MVVAAPAPPKLFVGEQPRGVDGDGEGLPPQDGVESDIEEAEAEVDPNRDQQSRQDHVDMIGEADERSDFDQIPMANTLI